MGGVLKGRSGRVKTRSWLSMVRIDAWMHLCMDGGILICLQPDWSADHQHRIRRAVLSSH